VNLHVSDGFVLREKSIAALIMQAAGNHRDLGTSLAQGESEIGEQYTGRRVVRVKVAVEKYHTHQEDRRLPDPNLAAPGLRQVMTRQRGAKTPRPLLNVQKVTLVRDLAVWHCCHNAPGKRIWPRRIVCELHLAQVQREGGEPLWSRDSLGAMPCTVWRSYRSLPGS
jgi:hypothetical protein